MDENLKIIDAFLGGKEYEGKFYRVRDGFLYKRSLIDSEMDIALMKKHGEHIVSDFRCVDMDFARIFNKMFILSGAKNPVILDTDDLDDLFPKVEKFVSRIMEFCVNTFYALTFSDKRVEYTSPYKDIHVDGNLLFYIMHSGGKQTYVGGNVVFSISLETGEVSSGFFDKNNDFKILE